MRSICAAAVLFATFLSFGATPAALAQDLVVNAGNSPYVVGVDTAFDNVTVESAGELQITDATLTANVNVEVQTGGLVTMTLGRIVAPDMQIRTGAEVTLALDGYPMLLEISGTLNVDAGGLISGDDVGLHGAPTGYGPRQAETLDPVQFILAAGAREKAGGSHGGFGSRVNNPLSYLAPLYGDPLQPLWPGAGGGRATSSSGRGGHGGGALHITAGVVDVSGTLQMLGGEGTAGTPQAGGAGGSILIEAATISGGGTISTKGGRGRGSGCATTGGGGSGGRVALIAPSLTFSGTIDVDGNVAQYCTTATVLGGRGTIYTEANDGADVSVDNFLYVADDSTNLNSITLADAAELDITSTATVTQPIAIPAGATVRLLSPDAAVSFASPIEGTLILDHLDIDMPLDLDVDGTLIVSAPANISTLIASGSVEVNAGLTTTGNLELTDTGVLTHAAGNNGFALNVGGLLTVGLAASIDVSAKGLAPGPDAGYGDHGEALDPALLQPTTGSGPGNGGSHGGLAVLQNGAEPVNPTYGDYRMPDHLGAGGGAGTERGGYGGGKVVITSAGLRVDGAIRADGEEGLAGATTSGSGAGGSIWITTGTFAGNGNISADGGGVASGAAGAGGGRISITTTDDTFTGSTSVAGTGGSDGGSIFLLDSPGDATMVTGTASIGATDVYDSFALGTGAVLEVNGAATITAPLDVALATTVRLDASDALDNITLTMPIQGRLEVHADLTLPYDLELTGTLSLNSRLQAPNVSTVFGALITHEPGATDMDLVADQRIDLVVGASVDVSGLGLGGGNNSGFGEAGATINRTTGLVVSGSTETAGGSHLTLGGVCGGNGTPAATYDTPLTPVYPGGGGGAVGAIDGGTGGGVARLTAMILDVSGSIDASGLPGQGGGAGGVIDLDAVDWRGNGSIIANGGDGGLGASEGGGGAGGVIHILHDAKSFTGTLTADAGADLIATTCTAAADGLVTETAANRAPVILSTPASLLVAVGNEYSYDAEAVGGPPLTWTRKNLV